MKKFNRLLGITCLILILTTCLVGCTSIDSDASPTKAEVEPSLPDIIEEELEPSLHDIKEELEPLPTKNLTPSLNLKSYSVDNSVVQPDGYSYTLTITVWESLPKSDSIPVHPLDSSFSVSFDPKTDIAIPVRFQLQNTTQGYDLEGLKTSIYLEGISDVKDFDFFNPPPCLFWLY